LIRSPRTRVLPPKMARNFTHNQSQRCRATAARHRELAELSLDEARRARHLRYAFLLDRRAAEMTSRADSPLSGAILRRALVRAVKAVFAPNWRAPRAIS